LRQVPKDKIKKFRDPTKPKRGMSAFMLFSNDIRPKVKADNPSLAFGDVAREITRIWKDSPPEVHMVSAPACMLCKGVREGSPMWMWGAFAEVFAVGGGG
jgi:HMG (high mobility group) box